MPVSVFSPVILDAPLGQTSDVWVKVEPILAKTTRVSFLFFDLIFVEITFWSY